MNIIFCASEVAPFAKTGGLADVCGSLPKILSDLGHDVTIVMPEYQGIKEKFNLKECSFNTEIKFKEEKKNIKCLSYRINEKLKVIFIEHRDYYYRDGLYGSKDGDHKDNFERFSFFSRAVFELIKRNYLAADIIHCHDWQTGLLPAMIKFSGNEKVYSIPCLFTIHNVAYQGLFDPALWDITALPRSAFSVNGFEYYGKINILKGGIVFSDMVTTVSSKYAEEIKTIDFGYGLDSVLREKGNRVVGIINGVDYKDWDPVNDKYIAKQYTVGSIANKKECKRDLYKVLGFNETDINDPLFGSIGRLAEQKGIGIMCDALERLLANKNAKFVLLGTGDEKYHQRVLALQERFKDKCKIMITFSEELAHKIEAGCDMFLMPSKYEPCGLNQIYSLRYGTIPIVRATGGLDDTISSFDEKSGSGTGFKFTNYSSDELFAKMEESIALFNRPSLWNKLIENAMKEDFSWLNSARKYLELYKSLL